MTEQENQGRKDPENTPPSNSVRRADGRVARPFRAGKVAKSAQNGEKQQGASLRGRPRTTEVIVSTAGQRQLLAAGSVSHVARLVGVSEQQITKWRAGERRPRPENARRLLAALGIPVDAWTASAADAAPAQPPARGPMAPSTTFAPTSLQEIEEMLVELRAPRPALTEREVAKRISERRALLGLKARIEHQERLAEEAIVRTHPQWAALRSAIRTALAPHPEALEALRTHLAALRVWEEAKDALAAGDIEDAPEDVP